MVTSWASEGASAALVPLGWVPAGDPVLQKINSGGNGSLCPLIDAEVNLLLLLHSIIKTYKVTRCPAGGIAELPTRAVWFGDGWWKCAPRFWHVCASGVRRR